MEDNSEIVRDCQINRMSNQVKEDRGGAVGIAFIICSSVAGTSRVFNFSLKISFATNLSMKLIWNFEDFLEASGYDLRGIPFYYIHLIWEPLQSRACLK